MRALRRAGAAALVAGVVFLAGFAWFVHAALHAAAVPPHADGIVALTGGADRVETALRLLAEDHAALLLVSGVSQRAGLAALTERIGLAPQTVASRVTLGRTATSTYSNAGETAAWVKQHGLHSLIVVTAGYHMARALLELRRALPEVTLYPAPVQPQGESARLLFSEYLKLLAAWAGVTRILPPPLALPGSAGAKAPVEKSPGGTIPGGTMPGGKSVGESSPVDKLGGG